MVDYCYQLMNRDSGRVSANRLRLGVSKQFEGNSPSGIANVGATSVRLC